MSSAITETATYTASVIGPDGTDPRTAASVRTPLQHLANRTKFLKEAFVTAQAKTVSMAGIAYPASTTYAVISDGGTNATFTLTVAVGDILQLFSAGSIIGSVSGVSYLFEWHDGTTQLLEQGYRTDSIYSQPFSVNAVHVVSTAGAKTFSLRAKRSGGVVTVDGGTNLTIHYVHIKSGT